MTPEQARELEQRLTDLANELGAYAGAAKRKGPDYARSVTLFHGQSNGVWKAISIVREYL